MQATVLLANSAQAESSGVVHALGLGWTYTGTPVGQHAVVVFLEFDPHEQDRSHQVRLELIDEDGNLISFGTDDTTGEFAPLVIEGQIEASTHLASTPWNAASHAIAFNIAAGMPLAAGTRYEWRLDVDNVFLTRRSFTVAST